MNLSQKVSENRLSETDYRSLKTHLNYSRIKLFDNDREKFFKEVILDEKKIEKTSASLVLGSLVHCLLSGADGDFDSKFHLAITKPPTGQMLLLVEELYSRSLKSLNEYQEQQDSFKIIFTDAVNKVKYDYEGNEINFKKKDESKILELFEGTNSEMYYKEMLQCIGKTLVTVPLIESAERLVQKVKESDVTSQYVNATTTWVDELRGIIATEVFNELPILFEMNEVPCRVMPDKMIVNHINKVITPLDYKCSWQSSDSIENVYLKYGYYIQAAFYNEGIKDWAKQNKMGDYNIEPMKFIFLDTTGFNSPFILKLSNDDLERSMRGFKVRSYRYKGILQLMNEITHHLTTGNWTMSYDEYKNKGVMPLNLPYGSRN